VGKRDLRIDLIEPFANMVDGVLCEGIRHSIPLWAGGGAPAHPQNKVSFSFLPTQFLPELSSKRVQVNIFDSAVGQMLMPPFSDALGFSHQVPVSGFIAGASKPTFFHEGLKEMNGVVIDLKPIGGNPSDAKSQYFRGQTFDVDPGKHQKAGIIGHQMKIVFPRRSIPADE